MQTRRPSHQCQSVANRPLHVEQLERRELLSISPYVTNARDLNVSDMVGLPSTSHQAEMELAINKKNPSMLAAFTRTFASSEDLDLLLSYDYGITWSRIRIDGSVDGHTDTNDRADPVVAFDENGVLFFSYIVGDPGPPGRGIVLGRMVDHDVSTIETIDIDARGDQFPDKPTIATGVDPSTGDQAVYVTWHRTLNFKRNVAVWGSNDATGSSTLANATSVFVPNIKDDLDSTVEFTEIAVGSDGEVYVAWHDRGLTL